VPTNYGITFGYKELGSLTRRADGNAIEHRTTVDEDSRVVRDEVPTGVIDGRGKPAENAAWLSMDVLFHLVNESVQVDHFDYIALKLPGGRKDKEEPI